MRLRRVSDRRAVSVRQRGTTGSMRPHWSEIFSFGLVGVSLGAAIIASVHFLANGNSSDASVATPLTPIAAPIPVLTTKENPLRAQVLFSSEKEWRSEDALQAAFQRVARYGKEDLRPGNPLFAARVISASYEQQETPEYSVRPRPTPRARISLPKLAATPPVWKLEQNWRLGRSERLRLLAQRRKRLRERMCLAKAIYFEARSESIKGQMAVAKVVLNRVRDPRFPNTICGVVYQGAERRNACQFSFACDGKPDYPANARQWAIAKRIAAKAMRGQIRLRGFEGVAFYHADYVRPTWASMMRPVIKIGRHIFYRDS